MPEQLNHVVLLGGKCVKKCHTADAYTSYKTDISSHHLSERI